MKAWFDRWKFSIMAILVAVLGFYTIAQDRALVFLVEHSRVLQGEVIRLEKKLNAYVILVNRWNKQQDADLDMMAGNLIEKGLITDTGASRRGPGFNLIIPPPMPGILDGAPEPWKDE